jgi:hypothetical protein
MHPAADHLPTRRITATVRSLDFRPAAVLAVVCRALPFAPDATRRIFAGRIDPSSALVCLARSGRARQQKPMASISSPSSARAASPGLVPLMHRAADRPDLTVLHVGPHHVAQRHLIRT